MGLPIIDHHITKDKAKEIKDRFQTNNPGKIKRFAFDAKQVQEVINQTGCTHVAIYPASKDDGTDTVVVAALDVQAQELSVMLEEAISCPPYCS